MKKILSSLAVAAAAALATPAQAAIVLSFSATNTHIAVGQNTDVMLSISGLGPEILSAFDLDVLFDGGVLTNGSVAHDAASNGEFGAILDPLNQLSAVFGSGATEVIDYSLEDDATLAANQSDAFLLLTFSFAGMADGSTFIDLGADPIFQRNFVGLNFSSLDVTSQGICISVGLSTDCASSAVPEPASYSLAALALAGAFAPGALRRRRRLGT